MTKAVGDKLFYLLGKTIVAARPPKSSRATLDGVVYVLSKVSEGKTISVFKHSPDEDSKPGKVVSIMQQLISNIPALNDLILNEIETNINRLLSVENEYNKLAATSSEIPIAETYSGFLLAPRRTSFTDSS